MPTPDAARILLVEDDDGLRNAYRIVLGARGFDVGTAATGEEALERLDGRAGLPSVIVADLGLPGLSGPDLVQRLSAAAPDAALLVLTGTRDDSVRQRCLTAGATRYMVKPVTGGDLQVAIVEARASSISDRRSEPAEEEAGGEARGPGSHDRELAGDE